MGLLFPAFCTTVHHMRSSITIDRALDQDLQHAASVTREKRSTLIRLALRAGLSVVVNRFQAPRPEGYFVDDYAKADQERVRLENAHAKALRQRSER
jgi:hypothetical protein